MINIESSKEAGVDKLSGRLLNDDANILAKPIFEHCNLSISQGVFPNACKVAKLRSIFKKKKTDPQANLIASNNFEDQWTKEMLFYRMETYYNINQDFEVINQQICFCL